MEKVKPIGNELKAKFVKHLCTKVADSINVESIYNHSNGISNFIMFASETHNSDQILRLINENLATELREFIETETGENAREYDRSVALFESESTEVNLTIIW